MNRERILSHIAPHLPKGLKAVARKAYYRNRHWAHPGLKGFGTVQDLYYWVADDRLDTLLLLQNYFSVLYPSLETNTEGTVSIRSSEGEQLGETRFSLAQCGSAKLRVSSLLTQMDAAAGNSFGTLEVNIAIPAQVLENIKEQKSLYFWDRFYVTYVNAQGQTCFVHGIDKTHIYQQGKPESLDWYSKPQDRQWAPEIPVDIDDYQKFSVILINRTPRRANMTLILSDSNDRSLTWTKDIAPNGVGRFELTANETAGLAGTELRMMIKGMATTWGRPMVFKEFANGAISAMHC